MVSATSVLYDKLKLVFTYIAYLINAGFLIVIAFREGFVPYFTLPGLGINYVVMGLGRILSKTPDFSLNVSKVMYPYGTEIVQMQFPYFVISTLNKIINRIEISTVSFYFFVYIVSITSIFFLSYKITNSKIISSFIPVVFYFDPFLAQVPAIKLAFMLLPLGVLLDAYIFAGTLPSGKLKLIFLFLLSFLIRILFPLTTLYIGVILAAASCLFFLLVYLLKHGFKMDKEKLNKYFFFVFLPWVLALLIVKGIIPHGISTMAASLDFIRGNSPDWLTLLLPPESVYLSKVFSVRNHLMQQGRIFSGDGTMWNNYLGVPLFLAGIYTVFKQGKTNKVVMALSLVALITFLLALGPSLKINSTIPYTETVTYDNYLLSSEQVVFDFPWKHVYSVFPLNVMRAVYRWLIIPKFILLLNLAYIMRGFILEKRHCLAGFIGLLVFIDFLPKDISVSKGTQILSKMKQFNADVIEPLRGFKFDPEDRVVFVPAENDYLAPYIAAKVNFTTYNGGGDKALALAGRTFPISIKNLLNAKDPAEISRLILEVKEKQLADYIILPFFSLRWESYYWPISNSKQADMREQALLVEKQLGSRVKVIKKGYFDLINLKEGFSSTKVKLVNPSFKQGLTGWQKHNKPDIVKTGFKDEAAVAVDKDNVIYQKFNAREFPDINVSFVARLADDEEYNEGLFEIAWIDGTDKVLFVDRIMFTPSSDSYLRVSKDFEIPHGAKYGIIKLSAVKPGNRIIIDNLRMVRLNSKVYKIDSTNV